MKKIHLQGIGKQTAIEAGEIKPGMVLVWNYGIKSLVVEIAKETAKSLVIRTRSNNGKIYDRRLLKSRLVGIAE